MNKRDSQSEAVLTTATIPDKTDFNSGKRLLNSRAPSSKGSWVDLLFTVLVLRTLDPQSGDPCKILTVAMVRFPMVDLALTSTNVLKQPVTTAENQFATISMVDFIAHVLMVLWSCKLWWSQLSLLTLWFIQYETVWISKFTWIRPETAVYTSVPGVILFH